MSLVTLHNQSLTVGIATRGAELQSIVDQNGVERLWQGDPAVWKGRAPILFPVAGAFLDDGYELNNQWYPMQKHGFARFEEWDVEQAEDERATLLLTKRDPGFPFRYEFRARFALNGHRLLVEYDVKNTDDQPFWFSVGAHEGYATPGGVERYELHFDEKETLMRYPLENGNLIYREPVCLGENTSVLKLSPDLFQKTAIVFRNLKSTGVTLACSDHPRTIHVDFAGNPTLMFWQIPGADYLCIEPWNNSPDWVDAERRIDRKPDFICLKPGQSEARSHGITIR